MLKTTVLTLILLGLFFVSCTSQVVSDSISVDGHDRSFHFSRPQPGRTNSSLVFILHGSGGNGKDMMERAAGLAKISANENVLLVYPDGYKKYWNECRKAANSRANIEDINEQAFFDGMIRYFTARYHIDDQKVFAVGTSGGGHMCYKLAMTMPQKFKAIAAIIANLPDTDNLDCEEAKAPMAVMIVNGTADPLNHYNGGMMEAGNFKMGNVRSTDRTFQYWAALAGYDGNPVKESVPDADPADGKTIERYVYKKKGKPEVVLLKVIGGKHDYPNDIDVHVEAWEFFKRQIATGNR
jgi:polyhydroxybutyrate depolymerase